MSAFDELCRRAASEFLQTVVIVDNMAAYPTMEREVEGNLFEPDPLASAEAPANDEVRVADPISEAALDAGAISQTFARAGLVCSILRPSAQEHLEDEVLTAAARSDILVLDWQMNDEGALATRIVRRLVEQDEEAGGRLRLIAIYTGQSPLAPVRDQLKDGFPKLEVSGEEVALACGSTKVIFLTKAAASVLPGEAGLSVAPDDLAPRLVQEFAAFAGGLLPNAVLAAIAGVRLHTHKVLARFNRNLDGPFLTHRALLKTSIDAEQFAATLILAELEAKVPLELITADYLGESAIRDYVEHRMQAGLKPRLMLDKAGDKLLDLELDQVCNLIENGMGVFTADQTKQIAEKEKIKFPERLHDSLRKDLHNRLYALADDDVETGKRNHEQFAIAAKIKKDGLSVNGDSPDNLPKLRLGTLLVDDAGDYWLCVTPLCDSERIPPEGGRFMLAALERSDDHGDFIIEDRGQTIRLTPHVKRIKISTHIFLPDAHNFVRASYEKDAAYFISEANPPPPWGDAIRFRWLAELKPLQAQRFAGRLANSLSRIGLDDFEWHRMRDTADGSAD